MLQQPAYSFFAGCPRNLSDLAAAEIDGFKTSAIAGEDKIHPGGVSFKSTLESGYRHLLWSRISSRLLLQLASFEANNPDELYRGTLSIPWHEHLTPDVTLVVRSDLKNTDVVNHSTFASQKVKDAIVDQFRENCGKRPSVDFKNPDITVHLFLDRNSATISLDLSGESLHKRGYRVQAGPAPLKENVAAAILIRAGWPDIAKKGGAFIDPLCGSGTLLIEAAMMAGDIAPGLIRKKHGFSAWKMHDPGLWRRLVIEAEERRLAGSVKIPAIVGWDCSKRAVAAAAANIEAAGLKDKIHVEKRDLTQARAPHLKPGLIVSNPPYGQRLGHMEELIPLYKSLGAILTQEFKGWRASILSGSRELSMATGLKAGKVNTIFNGPIECTLATFQIYSEQEKEDIREEIKAKKDFRPALSPGAEMFANRLKKNLKRLKKWAKKNRITSYRIYDADMPEYSAAIDYYEGQWINLQEYMPPKTVDPGQAGKHLDEMIKGLTAVLDIPRRNIHVKTRKQQPGLAQYEKIAHTGERHKIREGGNIFLINLTDYLDTGIFLDQRLIREIFGQLAETKRVLNLFAYTGTATVYAARGGAGATTTVDNSNTYLDWAKENMRLNGFSGQQHSFIKADCLSWLENAELEYDLILLDPPTFSNSKGMKRTLDIQRDHVELIWKTIKLLAPGGTLLFSTNFRKFRMDMEKLPELNVEDISGQTIPPDFERNRKIHYCWKIRRRREHPSLS